MGRILIAGILGGLAMFAGGAFSHMFLEFESRQFARMNDESAVKEFITTQGFRSGMYDFPTMSADYDRMSQAEKDADANRLNSDFKQGPSGLLIIAPTGEDMMGPKQLAGELIANILAALLAAFVTAHFTMAASFSRRWLLIVLMAPIAWLTLTLSFTLWYRFPIAFIQDGLFVGLIEWTLAGGVIAAIVQPIMHNRQI